MGLAIFLRKRLTPNHFRDLLIGSINTGLGDNALLCSGFFQENQESWGRRGHYQVSTEGNFSQILINNKINLTTVGIYNDYWLDSYRNFRNNLQAAGVTVTAKVATQFHWHAKIFVLKKGATPIFGIVGSSNMTRRAFGQERDFNNEADVIMWDDKHKEFSDLMNSTRELLNQFQNEIIIADYAPDKNFGLTIEQRLQQLSDDVNKIELRDLE